MTFFLEHRTHSLHLMWSLSCTRQHIHAHLHIDIFCIHPNWSGCCFTPFSQILDAQYEIWTKRSSQETGSEKPKLQSGNRCNVLEWNCSLVLSVSWHSTCTWSRTWVQPLHCSVFGVRAVIQSSPPCWNTAGKSRQAVVWSAAGGRLPRCCLDTLLPASSRQPGDTHAHISMHAHKPKKTHRHIHYHISRAWCAVKRAQLGRQNCNCVHLIWLNKKKSLCVCRFTVNNNKLWWYCTKFSLTRSGAVSITRFFFSCDFKSTWVICVTSRISSARRASNIYITLWLQMICESSASFEGKNSTPTNALLNPWLKG